MMKLIIALLAFAGALLAQNPSPCVSVRNSATPGQVLSAATSGRPPQCQWITGGGGASVSLTGSNGISVSPNPITGTGVISGVNAAADGATKGVATFVATDFNASTGLISLDYTNGQKASGSQPGFLSSADWTKFNSSASGWTYWVKGQCQNTVSGWNISIPSGGPDPTICSGSNTARGVLTFTTAAAQDSYFQLHFPPGWDPSTKTLSATLLVISADSNTGHNYVFRLGTTCVSPGGSADPSSYTANNFASTPANGTESIIVSIAISSLNLSGCSTGDDFYAKFSQLNTATVTTPRLLELVLQGN